MRVNAAECTMQELVRYSIRVNGVVQHFCTLFDTELGIAEFDMYYIVNDRRVPLHSYDEDTDNFVVHTYTLHSFEVWHTGSNELVAKV